jgi:hypothetical protein
MRTVSDPGGVATEQQIKTAILVRGVRVVPPHWFILNDHDALAAAIDEYLSDFNATMHYYPEPSNGVHLPMTLIFHDVKGQNWYNTTTRVTNMEWPRGFTGKPKRGKFAPLLHTALVLDRRRALGTHNSAFSSAERDAINRGVSLPVVLLTKNPHLFD